MADIRDKELEGAEKKRILIIEQRDINRSILENTLRDDYELSFAETGAAGLQAMRDGAETISLVLLDLNLPDMKGMDILKLQMKDKRLLRLPVIVLTSDRDAEVESLAFGAIDFLPKPYPRPEVIRARALRTIELSEGRILIGQTERDQLTGLHNREYFYRRAEQYDLHHSDTAMDAIVIDINHFHLLNERYGKAYGDEVLVRIGEELKTFVGEEEGLICRRGADIFLIYCEHRADYTQMLERVSDAAIGDGSTQRIVRLRMGVYSCVDRGIDIERRFDRAKMASDTVRSTFMKAVAIYDSALHESAIFAEQLMEDFQSGTEAGQFKVCYQPKYDVRGEQPALCSAEALVRWQHPEFGLINPSVFVPLFEDNGLIEKLDRYVWREAARQLRSWKDRLGTCVPVSVNVSRVDMEDAHLVQHMQSLVREYGIEPGELLLEITESAYTEDTDHIVDTVTKLREAGFRIEMDDFGSGYSSLNMLSSMPIDALKLDMQFIRNAFKNGKNTRMLEVMIEIADSLCVPVVAEGVETAEQMFTLKSMGCDIIQGYYFSKPIPAEAFEKLLEGQTSVRSMPETVGKPRRIAHDRHTYGAMHDPQTGLYNNSAFDILLYDADMKHTAVLIADVDDFQTMVEKGEAFTDRVIRRVASALRGSFRATDFVCRIRQDEFAVILTRVDSSQRDVILDKVFYAGAQLVDAREDTPPVTLSVGLAFGDRENPAGDIFQDADAALNRAKSAGRSGCAVY